MSYIGKVYVTQGGFYPAHEYIVMEQLTNTVALMDVESNDIHWVSLHDLLHSKYKLKSEVTNAKAK